MIRLSKLVTEAVAAKFDPIKLKHKYKDYAPAFDEETMKTHFTKHYQGYIDKLNEAVKEADKQLEQPKPKYTKEQTAIYHLQKEQKALKAGIDELLLRIPKE